MRALKKKEEGRAARSLSLLHPSLPFHSNLLSLWRWFLSGFHSPSASLPASPSVRPSAVGRRGRDWNVNLAFFSAAVASYSGEGSCSCVLLQYEKQKGLFSCSKADRSTLCLFPSFMKEMFPWKFPGAGGQNFRPDQGAQTNTVGATARGVSGLLPQCSV